MKKVLTFVALAAMVCFVSCQKANSGKKGGKDSGKTEYVQPITIDGQFDDWAKLDASKVAVAKHTEGATHDALKVLKVYADANFIFLYLEWNPEMISWELDVEHVPFHIYLNGDGDDKTGGFADQWSDACMDSCFEGFLTDGNNIASYDPGVYSWIGVANGEGWKWSDPAVLDPGSGVCSGAGAASGKYEIQLTRELYPLGKIAKNFSIGVDIQQGWNSVGVLPNAAATDDNPAGTAPSLQVTTVE